MPVYVIRAGEHGPVKIGYAEDVALRMAKMQADNHERLILLREFEGGLAEEASLHIRFNDLRISGEWFSFSRLMMADLGLADRAIKRADALEQLRELYRRPASTKRVDDILSGIGPSFGDRLRAARIASGMSQLQLEAKAHLGRSVVTRFEGGTREPSLDVLVRLASVLDCSIDWLLRTTNDMADAA